MRLDTNKRVSSYSCRINHKNCWCYIFSSSKWQFLCSNLAAKICAIGGWIWHCDEKIGHTIHYWVLVTRMHKTVTHKQMEHTSEARFVHSIMQQSNVPWNTMRDWLTSATNKFHSIWPNCNITKWQLELLQTKNRIYQATWFEIQK